MKKIIFFLQFSTFIAFSQAPVIEWQKRIGGVDLDIARNMIPTNDNGFFIGGYSKSNTSYEKTENCRGGGDYWVLKTDSLGNIEWDKTIGGSQINGDISNENDILKSVLQTPDGGFIISGDSNSEISSEKTDYCRGNYDYWILKLGNNGYIEWQKTFGGNLAENIATVISTTDGGILIAGSSLSGVSGDKTEECIGGSDIWLIKLNEDGNILWQKTIGGSESDSVNSLVENIDGSIVLAASSSSPISGNKTENSRGLSDIWLIKLDQFGAILNQKTIGGSGRDIALKIINSPNGSYIISCESDSPISGEKTNNCKGGSDEWILKIDNSFSIIWQHTYGGNNDDLLNGLIRCNDGGYLISGSSRSGISEDKTTPLLGYTDAWMLKLDNNGFIEWQKSIGGTSPGIYNGQDWLSSIAQLISGSYVLFGGTDSNISGNITEFPRGLTDYWLVKLYAENLSTNQNQQLDNIWIKNPIKNSLEINTNYAIQNASIKVKDMLGKELFSTSNVSINGSLEIPVSLFNGVYLVTISNNGNSVTKKIVKQ